ncbi:MAG: methyltransferase domain-containing protein [Acidobacteria bacterium]|nr:methyltransferase domain-containing protein [Acidobacteriota bacterium]
MFLFRKTDRYALPVSMAGVRMGDRLLQLGCGDGKLFAALAAKVGLTGRACAVDEREEIASRARRAAAEAGVLVEVEVASLRTLPYEEGAFDIVVLRDVLPTMSPEDRVWTLREVLRVLRPAGRCVVIEHAPRGGLGALFDRRPGDPHYLGARGAERSLEGEGFKAVRRLAEREGLAFVEGVKPRE